MAPCGTSRSIPRTASSVPYILWRPRTSTARSLTGRLYVLARAESALDRAEQVRRLNRRFDRVRALVALGAASPRQRLLFSVAGEHAKDAGYSRIERGVLDASRSLRSDMEDELCVVA